MDNRDFSNLGEQIRHTVEDAMNSMDYQQLNQKINRTVDMAMNEARRQFQNYQYGNRVPHVKPPVQPEQMNYGTYNNASTRPVKSKKKQEIRVKAKGRITSPLMIFFGGFYTWACIMVTVFGFGEMMAGLAGEEIFGAILGMLMMFGIFGGMLYAGIKSRIRYSCFKKYLKILDGREFCSVKELAQKTRKSEKYVVKKLKAIIKKGMFVDGFVDDQGTCLIVTKEAYYQFEQAQESRRQREMEEARRQEEMRARQATPESEIEAMIRKGNEYIECIRIANDAIPGEIISAKLDRLELVIRKIFESVKKHPEQMDEMDKFMEYYLPTTQKLVNAYKEFDALPVKGENVTTAMNEIENTLDTISHAFEQLLDDLFQDTAFDISSDISVLQAMFAKEGYKEKDFK